MISSDIWVEAVGTACYLVNRSPTKGLQVSPEERFSGEKPELSNLLVFGTRTMTHIPKVGRKKWDPKSQEGIFVGYAAGSKGYRVYNPRSRKVYVSRDVVFLNDGCTEELRDFEPEMLQFRMAAVDVNPEPEQDDEDGSAVAPPAGAIDGEELPISAEIALPPEQKGPHCEVRRREGALDPRQVQLFSVELQCCPSKSFPISGTSR